MPIQRMGYPFPLKGQPFDRRDGSRAELAFISLEKIIRDLGELPALWSHGFCPYGRQDE